MPLFQINGPSLSQIQHRSFQDVAMKEREHLQALVRDNVHALSEELLIISEEFSDWTDSKHRIDLLALDRESNLVVIELKRIEDGGFMDLQAIRYAAMISAMDFQKVVETYDRFLIKQGKDPSKSTEIIKTFLRCKDGEEISISNSPQIVLVAPSFSKEMTTTILWLIQRGINIKCIQALPYQLDENLYINFEQIIPLPSANAYLVSLNKKALIAEKQIKTKRRERTIPLLEAAALLLPGTRIHLVKPLRPNLKISDEKAKHATFLGEDGIRWDYDGVEYSDLTNLCRKICEIFGGDLRDGTFAGPDYWALEGEEIPLYLRAKQLIQTDEET